MTEENLTKVRYEEGQHRFREENRWERFLGGTSEAMEMIRRVAPIQKGKVFDINNVNLLRCGSKGLNGQNWENLLGKKAKRDYKIFECVDGGELEI